MPENDTTTAPTAPAPTEPAAAAPQTPAPPAAEWDGKVESLPTGVQKLITDLRRENASDRTSAKQTAAQEAEAALAQKIGKALGLVQDETVDPAALTQQLTVEREQAQQARVALAVYQAAAAAGGDPTALLDSASFQAKVKSIDPSDIAAVTAAVQEAVTANPRLGVATATAPVVPQPNPAQGSSGSGPAAPAQLSQDDVKRLFANKQYEEIAQAQADGRLTGLYTRS